MSAILVGLAKKARLGGDTTAKLVLIVLADYANDEGMAWPSVDTLTREVEVGSRTIQRSLRKLEALGLIRKGDQSFASRYRVDHRPVVYRLLPNGVTSKTPRTALDGVTLTTPREPVDGVTPVTPRGTSRGDTHVAHGVTPVTSRGDTHDTQTLKEPPLEPRESRARGNSKLRPIGDWVPDGTLRALAKQLNLDADTEFEKFRDRCLSEARTSADWPAAFRGWLRRGRELGLDKLPSAKPTPIPEPHIREPHHHTVGCEHVRELIAPFEWRLSAENTDGFGSSPLLRAKQALADRLNEGMETEAALADLGLSHADELEDVA